MFGAICKPQSYDNISTVMFFRPPVAAVGLNEKECRERKIAYKVGVYANALLPRAIAMRSTDGFVKIIVSQEKPYKILGMRTAGPQASNTIMTIAMLMDQNSGLEDALKTSHPHPTISEGIRSACGCCWGNRSTNRRYFLIWPVSAPESRRVKLMILNDLQKYPWRLV